MTALYQVGEKVFHKGTGKWGQVSAVFPDGHNGFRYYVDLSGVTWSVPEASLDTQKPRKSH